MIENHDINREITLFLWRPVLFNASIKIIGGILHGTDLHMSASIDVALLV